MMDIISNHNHDDKAYQFPDMVSLRLPYTLISLDENLAVLQRFIEANQRDQCHDEFGALYDRYPLVSNHGEIRAIGRNRYVKRILQRWSILLLWDRNDAYGE